jgi:hypothetical protein
MRRLLSMVCAASVIACARSADPISPPGTNAAGSWSGAIPGNGTLTFTLAQTADTLSGTWARYYADTINNDSGTVSDGTISGSELIFTIVGPASGENCTAITATLTTPSLMTGSYVTSNCLSGVATSPFSATRR